MATKAEPQTELNLKIGNDFECKVLSPRLKELKERECSVIELQAALVHLIVRYNEQGLRLQKAIHELQDYRKRRQIHDMLDEPFTL